MNSLGFLLLLLVLVAFSIVQLVHGNAELRALMDLKSSLDPEGKILSSWSSDGDPCSGLFQGVACNEHRKVANISLQGKGLSGWLSPSVAELKCLSGLYLHYNNLSGEIPPQISNLTELVDLYLDVNSLSGTIPTEIGNMASLQVVQLGDNQLVGSIPKQMGSLKQLSTLALQYNKLSGEIPLSLGNLEKLSRLNLSFNNFTGMIPATLAHLEQLKVLDIQNNSLSGFVPSGLKRLGDGFQGANNRGLCGVGFSTLRACNKDQDMKVNHIDDSDQDLPKNDDTENALPEPANVKLNCNQTHCSKSRRFPQAVITAGLVTITLTFFSVGFLTFVKYRRQKQRIRNTSDSSEGKLSPCQPKDFIRKSPSPLVNLEYHNGWDPLSNQNLNQVRFNVDEVESATLYFSEANLLSKSKFSAVYKGVLRDGSLVAIRSINSTCCKTEEAEFVKGLTLVTSLRHENLVSLRGFCCSRSRGECFLIYDFATKGNLSQYLDMEDGNGHVLEWSKRVSIIKGIAKGIGYLHGDEASKPSLVHQNISVENVLLDQQFNPLIMDAGLPKLLADDVVFSALKVSAAMGYLAPEYVTTGRFTEKSDIYAFGVIVLQVLSGKKTVGGSIRLAVESLRFDDFVDRNLRGRYSKHEATMLSRLATLCTHELPDQRPTMVDVIQELNVFPANS
ncbi:leucine-rich repeat receptor-like serine/threonine-protein kinase At1g17230 [Arachis stenosperma]|uniref:leucine-rich repeat receptor-like serine/threonine-protein kinase At1g17230 n=1 Tax=Arachis stenosperma TaxID=217475 RepID=UPI0025ACDD39|nr:leucine-rich repeat receptor-like serine/threonine-protein kinase At1g17230 [Arachis stenosperma]